MVEKWELPKEQQWTWPQQVQSNDCNLDLSDQVPSRFKPRYVAYANVREAAVNRPNLPLTISMGKIELDWNIHGIYRLGEPDEHGRVSLVITVGGTDVPRLTCQ